MDSHLLNLDVHVCKYIFQSEIKSRMAKSVGYDETACYDLSRQDVHYLHRYLYWTAGPKGLSQFVLVCFIKHAIIMATAQ